MKQSAPSMTSLLCSFEDTSAPLNIFTGNSSLKNTTTHDVSVLYAFNNYARQSNFTIKQSFFTTVNDLAYAYTIDRTTGNTSLPSAERRWQLHACHVHLALVPSRQ